MATNRQGMGMGTGKGYRNMIGKDPNVHSLSAKGIKQPQKVPFCFNKNSTFKKDYDERHKEPDYNETNITELELYTENNGDLYRQMILPYEKSLQKKMDKGIYSRELAIKGYLNVINEASRRYTIEYANKGDKIFSPADKLEVAKRMLNSFEVEQKLGNRL